MQNEYDHMTINYCLIMNTDHRGRDKRGARGLDALEDLVEVVDIHINKVVGAGIDDGGIIIWREQ